MKTIALTIFFIICCTVIGIGQAENAANSSPEKFFDGLYFGAAAGSQNVFGGSFVGGMDVLAQESRFVSELAVGFRKQFFQGRLLAGVEAHLGFTDGNLMHRDAEKQLYITYRNKTQSGIGLTLGTAIGKRKNAALYAYANETKRTFDVTVREKAKSYNQQDKQGMLKYGVGAEVRIWKGLNARLSAGGLRVDFGDLQTNINVEDKWDVMAGVVYQF